MPRYLVERFFERISDEDMLAAGMRSDRAIETEFPEITWDHSHVVVDDDGAIRTYCIYEAPNEEMVRAHANAFGGHVIGNLYEIVDDITPAIVRSRAEAAGITPAA